VFPRMLNVLFALWLIVSAFVWPHSTFQVANTLVCGFVSLALALAGLYRDDARYLGVVVAVWLFFSSVITMGAPSQATMWNNTLVAIGLLVTSLVGRPEPGRRLRTV
jgi:hypothetical membrane protein